MLVSVTVTGPDSPTGDRYTRGTLRGLDAGMSRRSKTSPQRSWHPFLRPSVSAAGTFVAGCPGPSADLPAAMCAAAEQAGRALKSAGFRQARIGYDQLPYGAVLVVGIGASRSQIADELNRAVRSEARSGGHQLASLASLPQQSQLGRMGVPGRANISSVGA
jgi:hypothetical protein